MSSLFGSATLLNKSGKHCSASSCLEGKHVGIYFASKTCPHCREFTSELITFYNEAKKKTESLLEIVFVSMDKDEAAAQEYFSEMPWLMLSFHDRTTRENLSSRFGVRSTPSLIVLDDKGNLLTKEGRMLVNRNIPVNKWCEKAKDFGGEGKEGELGKGEMGKGSLGMGENRGGFGKDIGKDIGRGDIGKDVGKMEHRDIGKERGDIGKGEISGGGVGYSGTHERGDKLDNLGKGAKEGEKSFGLGREGLKEGGVGKEGLKEGGVGKEQRKEGHLGGVTGSGTY